MSKKKFFLIGADIVPTVTNVDLFEKGDAETLVGAELQRILNGAEYRIFNLEVPLTDSESPIPKHGPALIAPVSSAAGYKALGIDLLTLANNHILDQGENGLNTTISALQKINIPFLGVGNTLEEAAKPFIFKFGDKTIGVYACAEHEFSIVTDKSAGANPFDPLYTSDDIAELKEKCDFVVVLYHGGKEHYRYPSPNLQRNCRRLVEKGADLVVCQHSHCIGCEEKYQEKTIVYGQGNFLFDLSNNIHWQTSMLIQVDENLEVSYIPLTKKENGVRIAEDAAGKEIITKFRERSKQIKTPGFVKEQYSKFAENNVDFYLRALSGRKSLLFRLLNKITKQKYYERYLRKTYSVAELIRIINYIECEAHSELMLTAIKNKL